MSCCVCFNACMKVFCNIILNVVLLTSGFVSFSQCQHDIKFFDITSGSPYNCSKKNVSLVAYDSLNAGAYIKPGFTVILNTDANSPAENWANFYRNGTFAATIPLGEVDADKMFYMVGEYFEQAPATWEFEWCDNQKTGIFNYEVRDHADWTVKASGTFTYNGTNQCFKIPFGSLHGDAEFYGPGVTNYYNGKGRFDASAAGPGIHKIIYCWNDSLGCYDCDTQTVVVVGPDVDAGSDQTICEGESVNIGANPTASGGAGLFKYKWEPAGDLNDNDISNPTASPGITTTYTITVTDYMGMGCSGTDNIVVNIDAINVDFAAAPTIAYLLNPQVSFTNTSVNTNSYVWKFGDGTTSNVENTIHEYSAEGVYTVWLIASDDYCTDSISKEVTIKDCILTIPNVITPNSDGYNDFFEIKNLLEYSKNNIRIYNRWGKKVYEKDNYRNDWNGTDVPDGTYYYVIQYSTDGIPNVKLKEKFISGTITVTR